MEYIYILLIIIIGIYYLNQSNREEFGSGGGALIQLMANASDNGNYPYLYTRCGNYKEKNNKKYDIKPYDNKKRSI
jgi:hypothetical protein